MTTPNRAADKAQESATVAGGRTVCRIDCTQERGSDEYFQSAETQVVESPLGAYREAAGTKEARFGYRFHVRTVGCPHELVIRYPDDKPRFMCVMDGSTYDLSTGVFSDGAVPVSGARREIRLIFWPRWSECTLVFMTWAEGEPAAVASFEVHELDALPPAPTPEADDGVERREFGMAFEDPCGAGLGLGASGREEWIERMAAFMRHSGQSLLIYPIAWYHGPQFPSQREPADAFELAVAPDHRMYGRYTTQPPEWVTPLLDAFSRKGLGFLAEVRFLRLGSLMQKMNINLDAIQAGADTINNMLWNGQVQSGTMDWTVVYNARNYPEMLARQLGVHVHEFKGFPFVYGEKCWADFGDEYPSSLVPPGAIFNPLHPVVQGAAIGFMRELAHRYGGHPAFRGVAVGLWCQTFLWYGSLRRGYDDVSVGRFQAETGIKVSVDAGDPDRFARRYAFLTEHCREEWIAWRCRRIRDLIIALRDALQEAAGDLRLVLVPNPGSLMWAEQAPDRPAAELLREAGFDAEMLAGEPGIEIDMTTEGAAGLHGPDTASIPPAAAAAGMPAPTGICIADSWVESWGRNRMFACDADDSNVPELARIGGQSAGIYRFTCEYPPDGFWYADQWRISTPFPAGEHYMAPLARALADTDALRLTRGGLYPDTAHAGPQRRFARAFCSLPRVKFDTLGGAAGAVVVRTATADGGRYLYAINRTPSPKSARLTIEAGSLQVRDLVTGEQVQRTDTWEVSLGPCELRSYALEGGGLVKRIR